MFENFDCTNTDYSPTGTGGDDDENPVGYLEPAASSGAEADQDEHFAPCNIQSSPAIFGGGRAPNVFALP